MKRTAFALLILTLGACSGSPHRTARTAPGEAGAPAPANASPSPLRVGRTAPPAVRMFAGTSSVLGTPVRFCTGGDCAAGDASPPRLTVAAGSVLTFAVGRAPASAVLDVTGTGGGRYSLPGATLMSWGRPIAAGTHRFTLSMTWRDGEGTWTFLVAART